MTSLNNKQRGFTIVELLIVIVVIGILAALVVTTFTGIQQKARNTERQTDIKAIHGQIEAYYAQNGSYPALGTQGSNDGINDSTWRAAQMKGLDAEALQDPKGTSTTLLVTATDTAYGYNPLSATDGACTTAANDCVKYTLRAEYEGSTDGFEKTNLN